MIYKLTNIFKNKILENLLHVGIIKFVNVFSKYLLVGYLIRTLGEENYGTLTWIDSFIQYFIVYINFGFDIFIVKKVIENKDNKEEVDIIISNVISLKSILFVSSYLLLTILLFILDVNQHKYLFYLMLFMGLGEVFFPLWYFQGVQKMKFLSITSLISKGLLVILTILFVTDKNNIELYVVLLVLCNLLYGGLGFYFLRSISKFSWVKINFVKVKEYFVDGFLFYLGKTSTLFMNFGTIFLIGKFFTKSLVAGFDISSKIIFVFVFVFEVIQQSFFPSVVASQNKKTLRKLLSAVLLMGLFFNLIVYFYSIDFLFYLGGTEMTKYNDLLKQLSILIPIIAITTVLGSCGLVAFGGLKKFNYSFVISAIVYVVAVFILNYFNFLTFENLVLTRILVDVLMVLLIIIFSFQLKLFNFNI